MLLESSELTEMKQYALKGPSINDAQFYPNVNFQFHYMVSYFGKSTYLPKNRTSFMDDPNVYNTNIFLGS